MTNDYNDSSEDEFYDCLSEPIKYYAVAHSKDKGTGFVTPDLKEAREKSKSIKGSRFIIVEDPIKARKFAFTPLKDDDKKLVKKSSEKKGIETFPSVNFKDLNILKAYIEKGNIDEVNSIIENNPRYLISEADNPQLLQVRFRYNAIHVAASNNKPKIIALILEYLRKDSLWDKLYPLADPSFLKSAKARLLDVYINSPDVGNNETPLHFASKFGYYDCIRELLMYKLTDKSLKNKAGQFAQDIICNRYKGEDKSEMTEKIVMLFSERYVALLNDQGVSQCLSYAELSETLMSCSESVRAYIGPIPTAEKAELIRRRWTCRSREEQMRYRSMRCGDAEKGIEAHGREIACEYGLKYHEKWTFLNGKLVDFNSSEGLNELESFLDDIDINDSESNENSNQSSSFMKLYESLTSMFARMTLSDKSQQNTPKTPSNLNESMNITKFDLSISHSGIITQDDKRIHQALKQTVLKSNSMLLSNDRYPRITKYVTEMDSLLLNQSNASLSMMSPLPKSRMLLSTNPAIQRSPSIHNKIFTSTPLTHKNDSRFPDDFMTPISPLNYKNLKR